jgi:GTP cyclohydrolase II
MDAKSPMAIRLSADDTADSILASVTDATSTRTRKAAPAGHAAAAAIQLVKLSQGLPAVLAAELGQNIFTSEPEITKVEANAVARFSDDAAQSLTLASEATVPLNSGISTRFIVFRDAMGGIEVAIIVGKPDFTKAMPVRLHSACLTADVFGSRRCDCGDQLRLAMARLDDLGGGVVLYLGQEGRGLGLANKMRTYRCRKTASIPSMQTPRLVSMTMSATMSRRAHAQDAQMHASHPAHQQPAKLDRLSKAGIEIVSRMPIEAPINADNRRYMTAKATRAGHRLDQLVAHLADPS